MTIEVAGPERIHRSIASDVTGLIAFVSFALIYTNIVSAVAAVQLLGSFGFPKPVMWLGVAALYSPWIIAITAGWEFVISLGRYSMRGIDQRKLGYFDHFYVFGLFVGTLVFLVVIAIFVASQSAAYLAEIGPSLKDGLWGYFGK